MFSKEERIKIKKDFWNSFSELYPRKWILYQTKIKDFSFKFHIDNKVAKVSLDIEMKNEELRFHYNEKIEALENILKEHIGEYFHDEALVLENGKIISRFWVQKDSVSLYNKNTWNEIFTFFYEKMNAFEMFFLECEDFIKN